MSKFLFTPLRNFIHSIAQSRLRQMMRGYRNLKNSGRLGAIAAVKRDLTTHNLGINQDFFSRHVFGAGLNCGEIIIRQYLLVHIGGFNLNRALLLSAGKSNSPVVFPMPSEWVNVVRGHGFEVDFFRSFLLWWLYVLLLYTHGLLKIAKVVSGSAFSIFKKRIKPKSYVYFDDLVSSNLPNDDGMTSFNIIAWYMGWSGRKAVIEAIHHNVSNTDRKRFRGIELISQSGPIPVLSGSEEFIKYASLVFPAIVFATIDLLRGRWWHSMLLSQLALSAQAHVVPTSFLAKEYLFHSSSWIYRPLWTYETSSKGATITFYSYSTNSHAFNNLGLTRPAPYGWAAGNWPRYLVWDQFQKDFICDAIGKSVEVIVVGPIWFQDDLNFQIQKTDAIVSVFDVQPHRNAKYQLYGLEYDYYTPEIAIKFLDDIQSVLAELNHKMLFKRKREIGNHAHPRYVEFVHSFSKTSNVISISPLISASRVIEVCDIVISMPFSSTALLGAYQGKLSVYYDSDGKVAKEDCAAHGIEVLIGKQELRAWLRNNLLNKMTQ
jgi:polysaccharide biosynthesis PFTS motif protein